MYYNTNNNGFIILNLNLRKYLYYVNVEVYIRSKQKPTYILNYFAD